MTSTRRSSLAFHHDFRQLWIGDSISQIGTQVSLIALPYIAVTILNATPLEMGFLGAFEFLAFLVVGLPAGAWVDRWRRQRVLITNDVIRAVALGSLPLAYALDALTLGQLYVVALAAGTATVFFDVAYQSYLPAIVDRGQITEGNSKLEVSRSLAQVAGPGTGGLLINSLGAPFVVVVDAVSYLASAFFVARIRHVEAVHDKSTRRSLRTEIGEGLSFVVRHRLLRRITLCTGTSNLFSAIGGAVLILYLVRDLNLSPGVIGLTLSAGSVGGLLGALAAAPLARRVGEGRVIPLATTVFGPFSFFLPLASYGAAVPLLILGGLGFAFGVVVYNINQVSFRQRLCPPRLLGRMNASIRFLVWGTLPIGALLGGFIADLTSVLTALWVAGAGSAVAALPVLLSPLSRMSTLPDELDEHAAPGDSSLAQPGSGSSPVQPAPGVLTEKPSP